MPVGPNGNANLCESFLYKLCQLVGGDGAQLHNFGRTVKGSIFIYEHLFKQMHTASKKGKCNSILLLDNGAKFGLKVTVNFDDLLELISTMAARLLFLFR